MNQADYAASTGYVEDDTTLYVNILVTDGSYDPHSSPAQVQAALEDAFDDGIPTYVIGFGADAQMPAPQWQAELDDMADWGSGGATTAYVVANQGELVAALRDIVAGLQLPCCKSIDCSPFGGADSEVPTTGPPIGAARMGVGAAAPTARAVTSGPRASTTTADARAVRRAGRTVPGWRSCSVPCAGGGRRGSPASDRRATCPSPRDGAGARFDARCASTMANVRDLLYLLAESPLAEDEIVAELRTDAAVVRACLDGLSRLGVVHGPSGERRLWGAVPEDAPFDVVIGTAKAAGVDVRGSLAELGAGGGEAPQPSPRSRPRR